MISSRRKRYLRRYRRALREISEARNFSVRHDAYGAALSEIHRLRSIASQALGEERRAQEAPRG